MATREQIQKAIERKRIQAELQKMRTPEISAEQQGRATLPFGEAVDAGFSTGVGSTVGGVQQINSQLANLMRSDASKGPAQPGMGDALANMFSRDEGKLADESRQRESKYKAAEEKSWLGAMLGNILGSAVATAPLSAIPGLGLPAHLAKNPWAKLGAGTGRGALEGSLGAASQYVPEDQSRISNAGFGAAFGSAVPVVGAGLSKYITPRAEPYAAAYQFEKMGDIIGPRQKNVFGQIKASDDSIKQVENMAWNKTKELAAMPAMKSKPFDSDIYKKMLGEEIKSLQGISKRSPFLASDYQGAVNILKEAKKADIKSWGDVVEVRKDLNKKYRQEMRAGATTGNEFMSDAVDKSLQALRNQIDTNLPDVPLPEFRSAWQNANDITRMRNEAFETILTPQGKKSSSPYANLKHNASAYALEDKVLAPYVPKLGDEGIGRMKQFSSMLGSKEKAASILRPETFKSAYNDGVIDTKKFFNQYQKLSEEQRKFLFDKGQYEFLENASKQYSKNPSAFGVGPSKTTDKIINFVFSPKGIIGGLGALGGSLAGPYGSAAGGALGVIAGEALAGPAAAKFLKSKESPYLEHMRRLLTTTVPAVYAQEEEKPKARKRSNE